MPEEAKLQISELEFAFEMNVPEIQVVGVLITSGQVFPKLQEVQAVAPYEEYVPVSHFFISVSFVVGHL